MTSPFGSELTLTLAFLTGVMGALHCLGMCTGLAGGYFVRYGSGVSAVLGYHAARILVYGILGAAGALVGRVLVQQGIVGKGQGLVMMAAGLLIIGIGLGLVWTSTRRGGGGSRSNHRSPGGQAVAHPTVGPRPRPWLAPLAGAINGLVPCSLTVSVAIKAAATADPLRAGLLMLVFGLGTLPTMALVSLTGTTIGRHARGVFAILAALTVVALGLWTLYEGWVFFDIMRGLSNW
jgi:sulfite exporter TauE/SafE